MTWAIGDEVGYYTPSSSGAARTGRSHITKIGKRDVVLEDGHRFNAATSQRSGGGSWGSTTYFVPVDSQEFLSRERLDAIDRLHGFVATRHAKFHRAPTPESARQLIEATVRWLQLKEEK